MKADKGIPILDSNEEIEQELSRNIAINALHTMTDELVKMERSGVTESVMMEKCVWPILHEAGRRFASIADGDLDVPDDGFNYVVG